MASAGCSRHLIPVTCLASVFRLHGAQKIGNEQRFLGSRAQQAGLTSHHVLFRRREQFLENAAKLYFFFFTLYLGFGQPKLLG